MAHTFKNVQISIKLTVHLAELKSMQGNLTVEQIMEV